MIVPLADEVTRIAVARISSQRAFDDQIQRRRDFCDER
jgi:hypothetical protein